MVCQVGVVFVIALMRMMLQMVNTKTHCAGREVRKIGDDRHHFVPAFVSENKIVSGVVNNDVIGMVRECSYAVGNKKTEPPVPETKFSHPQSDACLHDHN